MLLVKMMILQPS